MPNEILGTVPTSSAASIRPGQKHGMVTISMNGTIIARRASARMPNVPKTKPPVNPCQSDQSAFIPPS